MRIGATTTSRSKAFDRGEACDHVRGFRGLMARIRRTRAVDPFAKRFPALFDHADEIVRLMAGNGRYQAAKARDASGMPMPSSSSRP